MNDAFSPLSDEHEGQLLARLADGSLSERERVLVERYVARSPAARVRLERQRRVVRALRAGGPVIGDRVSISAPPAPRTWVARALRRWHGRDADAGRLIRGRCGRWFSN